MILFICGAILIIIAYIFCTINNANPSIILMTIIGVVFIIISISNKVDEERPKAIDVYRGKTTLKISYIDSVATDSVVVFKKYK